jgi:hypothetical protein
MPFMKDGWRKISGAVLSRSLFIKSGRKKQAFLKCGKRNLTAEIAELAEVEKAKGQRDQEISEKDLCVLRFHFVHPLVVFMRREFGRPLFPSFRRKSSAVSAHSAVQFFSSSPEGVAPDKFVENSKNIEFQTSYGMLIKKV